MAHLSFLFLNGSVSNSFSCDYLWLLADRDELDDLDEELLLLELDEELFDLELLEPELYDLELVLEVDELLGRVVLGLVVEVLGVVVLGFTVP